MTIQQNPELKAMQDLVKALDEVLGAGTWQESLFLRGLEKRVRDLRTEAEQVLVSLTTEANLKAPGFMAAQARNKAQHETELVYISLYQQNPNDLRKWEKTLRSITENSVSRPIYREQAHVEEMIRTRPDPSKESYIVVSVKTADIIKGLVGKASVDKSGNELLAIRDGGVLSHNIKRFVHAGRAYDFIEGALKLSENTSGPE